MSMPCLRVRDLLPELALDGLDPVEAREVEEHLATCAGCRKEAEAFREGAARLAFSLPAESPSPALGDRVQRAVVSARNGGPAATARKRPRRVLRIVVGAGLAAALVVSGSFVGAVATRGQVQVQKRAAEEGQAALRKSQHFIASFQQEIQRLQEQIANSRLPAAEQAKVFGALMSSPSNSGATGELLVVSIPGSTPDFVHLQANLPPNANGPFTVLFEQPHGDSIRAGGLVKTPNGDYVLSTDPRFFPDDDLSRLTGVVILDHTGGTVLTGPIQLITTPPSR